MSDSNLETLENLPDSSEELSELLKRDSFFVKDIASEINRFYNQGNFENIIIIIDNINHNWKLHIIRHVMCSEWLDLIYYCYEKIEFYDFYFLEDAFISAFHQRRVKIAEFFITLLNSKKIFISQYNIERLFEAALTNDCLEIVLLLFPYVNPNFIINKNGDTPLMYSILSSSYRCAEFLADYLDPSLTNVFGENSLMLAARMRLTFEEIDYGLDFSEIKERIFKKILDKSQNYINQEDIHGYTAEMSCDLMFKKFF